MREKIPPVLKIVIPTVLIIAGIVIIALYSYRIIEKNTAEAFNEQQLFLVKETAKSIEELLLHIESGLHNAGDFIAYYPQEKTLETIFYNKRGLIQALISVSKDGDIVYAYPGDVAGLLARGPGLKDIIAKAVQQGRSTRLTDLFAFDDGISFLLAVPASKTAQWVCCIADFNELKEKFIYPIRSGKTGYAWMIDKKGVLLAHPNKDMEGRKAIDVLKELWPEYSSLNLEALINKDMIGGEEGKGEYTGWHIGERQLTKKLVAYRPITFGNKLWSIGLSAPYIEAMAPVMESLNGPILFALCFIIIIVAGACLIIVQENRKRLVNQELTWSHEVFDSITDGLSIIDRDYRVLQVNSAVCAWQGKPPQFFKGRPCYEVFQQQQDKCVGCPAREAFATGQSVLRERVSTTLGGKKYYFHLTAYPLKDENGNTVKVAELVKDVTEEMALRAQLLQHERKSVIVKMSSQIAHEIRNPLGSLTLNIDLLEDEIDGFTGVNAEETKSLIGKIKSEIEGLHRVLLEYLECTRFPTIKTSKQDVSAVIEDLFMLLEEELRRKKIVFKTSFEYNLPLAYADHDQIHRAFLNILRNAIEAMQGGGTIEVTAQSVDSWIEISLADSGPGIPSENNEKIFTPFFTTKSGGTGLGLAITQHIIQEHKGEIICENRGAEAGVCFRIRLPKWQETRESKGAAV